MLNKNEIKDRQKEWANIWAHIRESWVMEHNIKTDVKVNTEDGEYIRRYFNIEVFRPENES